MAVIKNNYLFPIYCPDAELNVAGEKNFYANGDDIVDTMANADVYVQKIGDDMTGPLYFKKDDDTSHFSIIPRNSAGDSYDTNLVNHRGNLRLRTVPSDDPYDSEYKTHIMLSRPDAGHDVGDGNDILVKTQVSFLATPSENHHAANKYYVDDTNTLLKEDLEEQIEILNAQVIELEEEINSIAAAVVRGKWTNNSNDTVPGDTEYVLIKEDGTVTDNFQLAVKVLISEHDTEGGDHSFADVTENEYLQILNEENEAYGLYTVQTVTERNGANKYYEFEVTFDQSYNGDGMDEPLADGLARVKLFTPPVMSDEAFIIRSGDVMEGMLQFGKPDDYKGHLRVVGNKGTGPNQAVFDVKAADQVTGGDAYYYGRITEANHLITKQYYEANFQTGPKGDKGDKPGFSIGQVNTIPSDQVAQVTDTGSDGDIELNFDIPKGEKGDRGQKGVEVIIHDGTTPPSSNPRGSLLITSNNRFYLYY